ncbi:GreA/GreB family elongation factor [Stieleria maiorica]|uniref:GreA/GreB family elongation factor n=1 Tax=Stieleria maiorica TaxID=2795974 RepID=UPI001F1ECDA2|nr:GreA/GreB family elongation factor [Stieleria maiorica]
MVISSAAAILDKPYVSDLRRELGNATTVARLEVPGDVITINTSVRLRDLDPSKTETLTLVDPEETCVAEGKLSILSLLGAELLGRRVGEIVTLKVCRRELSKRIEKVTFQPERVGAFNLQRVAIFTPLTMSDLDCPCRFESTGD